MTDTVLNKTDDKTDCCFDLEAFLSPKFFKALSDPNRLQIFSHLAQSARPHTVSEISNCCPVDISVVSRHLQFLRDAGILEAQKQGKKVRYRLLTQKLVSKLRGFADAIEACCPHGECSFTAPKEVSDE